MTRLRSVEQTLVVEDLPSILSDKKSEVQEHIKGLSGYKQEDVESVIKYYNSLFEDKK